MISLVSRSVFTTRAISIGYIVNTETLLELTSETTATYRYNVIVKTSILLFNKKLPFCAFRQLSALFHLIIRIVFLRWICIGALREGRFS
jgi:hypothetical protein